VGLLLNAKLAARIPPLSQPIDLKGASLNEYAGKYTAPGRAAWVSIGQGELHLLYLGSPCLLSPIGKDGQLTCLVEWFFECPRERAGGSTFTHPGSGLYAGEKIEFIEDAGGRVVKARLGSVSFPRL
jgi:hypothetical protein